MSCFDLCDSMCPCSETICSLQVKKAYVKINNNDQQFPDLHKHQSHSCALKIFNSKPYYKNLKWTFLLLMTVVLFIQASFSFRPRLYCLCWINTSKITIFTFCPLQCLPFEIAAIPQIKKKRWPPGNLWQQTALANVIMWVRFFLH